MSVNPIWTGSLAFLVWRPLIGPWTLSLLLLCCAGVVHRSWRILVSRVGRRRAATLSTLRLCVLGGFLLALLDPGCERRVQPGERRPLVLVTDRSASMEVLDRGGSAGSRYQRAIGIAERIAREAPGGMPVLRYLADTGLEQTTRWPELLEATGQAPVRGTDLAAVLVRLAENPSTRDAAALVLLTDGGDTSIEPARVPESPMLLIGIGSTPEHWKDLSLESVQSPDRVETGGRLEIDAELRAHGTGDPTFSALLGEVRVFLEQQQEGAWILQGQTQIDLREGSALARFEAQAGEIAGDVLWRVRAEAIPGELSELNNQRTFSVRVAEESLHVLYYSRRIGADLKFLRQELGADPAIRFHSLLQTAEDRFLLQGDAQAWEEMSQLSGLPPLQSLRRFHGVLLGSFPAEAWTMEEMQALCAYVEQGGGLVWIGGEHSFDTAYAHSPLGDLVPWRILPSGEGLVRVPASILPTAEGRARWADAWRPFTDGNSLPEVSAWNRTGPLKPGAVAWLEARMPEGSFPFLVEQPYGRGRVFAVASNTTWRWALAGPPLDRLYRLFWRQTVRAACGQADIEGGLRVRLDRERIRPGMRVSLEVDLLHPTPRASASARLEGPDGLEVVGLERDEAISGRRRGTLVFRSRGSYHLTVESLLDGAVSETWERILAVEPGETEGSRLEVDHIALAALSSEAGGGYLQEEQEGDILHRLGALLTPQLRVETVSVASSGPGFLSAMLGLLFLEWFLRRKSNLI